MNLSQVPRITAPEKMNILRSGLHRYRDGMVSLHWSNDKRLHVTAFNDHGEPCGTLTVEPGSVVAVPEKGTAERVELQSHESAATVAEQFLARWVPGDLLPENQPGEGGQQHTIERLREQLDDHDKTITNLRDQLDDAGVHARNLNAELGEVKEERDQLEQRLRQLVENHQADIQGLEKERDALQAKVKGIQGALHMNQMWVHDARRQAQIAAGEANGARAKSEATKSRYFAALCQYEPVATLFGKDADREAVRQLLDYVVHGQLPEGLQNGFRQEAG